jgi:hypothetical protein
VIGVATPPDRNWDDARATARSEVHSLLAPGERQCTSCGARSRAASRTCPVCGAPYISRRTKPLGTRRAKLLVAIATLVVLGVAGALVAVLSPGIERTKSANAASAARASSGTIESLRRKNAAEQRLREATVDRRDPGSAAPASARTRARGVILGDLQQAIAADARARVRAGALSGPILSVQCSPFPPGSRVTLSAPVGSYACVAVNRLITSGSKVLGVFGDPFWARVDFARGRLAWCKTNPRPGEGGAGTGPPPVTLARECDLERSPPAGF